MVILKEDPNTFAYSSCMSQVALGFTAMQTKIITNRRTSITVAMFTKRDACLRPKTSPIMSVIRNRTGTKKMPTETRTPKMVVIFDPRVFTITMDETNRAKRKSRFIEILSSMLKVEILSMAIE